jgi:D-inositol-3-phosphate glycosyltransferase
MKNQMKVLFIEPMGFSGIFQHAYLLACSLQKLGVDIEIVTSDTNLELFNLQGEILIHRILGGMNQKQSIVSRGLKYFLSWYKLLKLIFQKKTRIIHFHQFTTLYADWLLFLVLRLLKKQIILSIHDVYPQRSSVPNRITKIFLWFLYRLPNFLIVHSQYSRSKLVQDFGIKKAKVKVIPHGNFFHYAPEFSLSSHEARIKLDLPTETPLLLFFGTIRKNKGLDILLKSLGLVKEKCQNFKLVIAGGLDRGEDFSKYQKIIEELDLANFVIPRIGYVPADLVNYYFGASNVVILPYKHIYQSGVVQLAYAFKRPVIASRVGGFEEEVSDQTTGILVEPENYYELGDQIVKLLSNPSYSDQLGSAGYKFAQEKFGWSKIAFDTLKVYQNQKSLN